MVMLLVGFVPHAGADEVRFIPDGEAAWHTRVEMIRSARKSIDVAVFIWRDDRTGMEMAGLLHEATRRGVRVRVIADGLARSLPVQVTAALAGVEFLHLHDYHPLLLHRPEWMNRRLHDKLIIADGRRMLIGGRNFTDRYYDRREDWNYIDLDLLLTGKACTEAQAYFEALWAGDDARDVNFGPLIRPLNNGRFIARTDRDFRDDRLAGVRRIEEALRTVNGGREPASSGGRPVSVSGKRMEFVHEEVPRTPRQSVCVTRIEELMRGARHEVWISTPWLVTTRRTGELLASCLERGVELHIVTNSLNACRDYLVFAAHARTCTSLAAKGAFIHLLPGPDSMHSKTIIIDRRIAIAGTLNFDPRSEFWNTESLALIQDAAAARELHAVVTAQAGASYLLDPAKPDLIGTARPSVGLRLKKAALPVLRLFSPLIRSLL